MRSLRILSEIQQLQRVTCICPYAGGHIVVDYTANRLYAIELAAAAPCTRDFSVLNTQNLAQISRADPQGLYHSLYGAENLTFGPKSTFNFAQSGQKTG